MIISTEIYNDTFRELNIYEQALLLYLAVRKNGKTGQCNPSHKAILFDLSMSECTLLKALLTLQKKGLLKRFPGKGRGHSTQYEIPLPQIGISDNTHAANSYLPAMEIPLPGSTLKRNRKENKEIPPGFAPDSFEYRLASKLWDSISNEGTSQKKPDLQAWARTFDLIHRVDGHSYHWILLTMEAARADKFWSKNIRSPESLRKQINAGKLDTFTPKTGEAMTDVELFEQEKQRQAAT